MHLPHQAPLYGCAVEQCDLNFGGLGWSAMILCHNNSFILYFNYICKFSYFLMSWKKIMFSGGEISCVLSVF